MKKIILILTAFALTGCYHKSELMHEKGIVVEKSFSPEFNGSGAGVGMSMNGDLVVTSNHIHKSEQFVIVFKCEHGVVFTIDRQELYAKLDKGMAVTIDYYETLDQDNKVIDFDFIDAN